MSVLTLWGGEYMPGRRVMGLKALVWLVNDLRERKVQCFLADAHSIVLSFVVKVVMVPSIV